MQEVKVGNICRDGSFGTIGVVTTLDARKVVGICVSTQNGGIVGNTWESFSPILLAENLDQWKRMGRV